MILRYIYNGTFDQNSIIQLFHENNIMEALKVAVNQLWSLLTHTFSFIMVILNLCITLLYLIFILLDYEKSPRDGLS
ncbi:MAG: hypothetical protein V8T49_07255 [Paraprevotella clara]